MSSNRRTQANKPSPADQLVAEPENVAPVGVYVEGIGDALAGAADDLTVAMLTNEADDAEHDAALVAAGDAEPTDEPAGDAVPAPAEQADPLVTFTDAYNAALASADPATGTIPTVNAEPMTSAYRALGAKRAALVAPITTQAMSDAIDAADMPKLSAIRGAARFLAEANATSTTREPKVTVDPVAVALAQVTALRTLEQYVVGLLAENDRASVLAEAQKVMSGERIDYVVDWAASGLPTKGNKRSGSTKSASGPRAGSTPLEPLILAAITASDTPLTASMLNKSCERSGGAVPNACERLVLAGKLVATTIKSGDRDVRAWSLADVATEEHAAA